MKPSKCIYCDSTSYGRPCLFSPTNTHAHTNNGGGCMYCGSKNKGSGCSYNPYGKNHISGTDFLSRSTLTSEKALVFHYLFEQVSKKNSMQEGYKSPLDRVYKRLAGLLSSTAMPLLETFNLTETPIYARLSKLQLNQTIHFKNKFFEVFKTFKNVVSEAYLTLPPEIVEESILSAFLDKNGH